MIRANLTVGIAAIARLREMRNAACSRLSRTLTRLDLQLRNIRFEHTNPGGRVFRAGGEAPRHGIFGRFVGGGRRKTGVTRGIGYAPIGTGMVDIRSDLCEIKEAFRHPITARAADVDARHLRIHLRQPPSRGFTLDGITLDVKGAIGAVLRESLRQ